MYYLCYNARSSLKEIYGTLDWATIDHCWVSRISFGIDYVTVHSIMVFGRQILMPDVAKVVAMVTAGARNVVPPRATPTPGGVVWRQLSSVTISPLSSR